jgi:hypothetical protein
MSKLFSIVFFCLIISNAAHSQYCQIKGDLLDSQTMQKLDSVKIEIYEGKMMYKVIYADSLGQYDTRMFQVVGPVSFRISRDGYNKGFQRFGKLKGNNIVFMDIKLKKVSETEMKKIKAREAANTDNKTRKKKYARVRRRSALPF